MGKNLRDINPKFWDYATHAKKPNKEELYKTDYLESHIKRALLVRLHEPFYSSVKIDNIFNIIDLNEYIKIEQAIRSIPGFSKYDRETDHNDVSAALALYRRYLQFLNKQSSFLEREELSEKEYCYSQDFEVSSIPEKKLTACVKDGQKYYKRNAKKAEKALEITNYQCEINHAHKSFINRSTNKQYVEAHHLIPLSAQDNFDYSLDVIENIVSLCPNCHRMLHHGSDIEQYLRKLLDERKNLLKKKGIDITFEKLLFYYLG